ncbi:TetR/AcrR family transcriptional regulator [Rothia kristinae]|uniref:TetR/AcrR family transcriptional regulator n=1 Tax=Rothia kristinae TaxID=37923 RepID=UPI0022E07858|nr:helix-turn-helix domain containing protein [Rothia kristinae]
MALTRERILETARDLLRSYGLGDLSMRRLATELGVAPGALYYHVRSKQELLSLLATRLLADAARPEEIPQDPREIAEELTATALSVLAALNEVTDAPEVVSIALALYPESVPQRERIRRLLLTAGLPPRRAQWGAGLLLATVLGLAQQAQDRALMLDAGTGGASPEAREDRAAEDFGVRAVVRGLLPHSPGGLSLPST